MQRIVMAAFEQGMFQHAEAGERVNALRRGVPVVQVKEGIERPQLYEVWQHEHAEWPATSKHVTRNSPPPVERSEYQVRTTLDLCAPRFLTILLANLRQFLKSERDRLSTL